MSNFRTTADLLDDVLRRCGEMTSSQGVSPRQTSTLLYLNQIHQTIISGGNELNVDVDEPWTWAKTRHPIIIQIQPSITSGTVSLTQGSITGAFSVAPIVNGASVSLTDWMIRPGNGPEIYTIANHTAGSTAFQIDAAFPQTTNASLNFAAFLLDYDLTPSYLIVNTENQILDYISNSVSLTVNSATIPVGAYTPTTLATAVAAALNAVADGNTYTCTYDSIQRLFKVTSNLAGTNPVFQPQGAGTNYYRSAWALLGYDYNNLTGASNYTSVYPQGSVVRLSNPGRVFYGTTSWSGQDDGRVGYLDNVAFDEAYSLPRIEQGTPNAFTLLSHNRFGKMKIRLNKYLSTTQNMRMEFDYIKEPHDLFNNSASIPLIPKSYRKILEFGAAYYLSIDKNDSKANSYLGIAQQSLKAMQKANRRELERTGRDFGQIVARPDMDPNSQKRLRVNQYGYDSYGY